MDPKKTVLLTLALLAALVALIPQDSAAVPAFARRHKISCTTCHAPIPRLKDYGEEFAGNGFIIPEEEKDRDYVIAGDDLLRLNRDFPLAVRFDAYAVYDKDKGAEYDLQAPWAMKLLSGGGLAPHVGYYFYFYMSERGEVAGIEDAIIHFDNLFESELDVAVGQFQTSDPLLKRELRLTYEDYLLYKPRIGLSGTNLTYDRGLMISYGIARTGTDLVATVTNGNGKDEADEDRKFDDGNRKNVGLRISQAVGEHLSVGGFYYTGEEDIDYDDGSFAAAGENEVTYWGPDFSFAYGPFALAAQYLMREDSAPLGAGVGVEDVETEGWLAELTISPQGDRSRHYFTVLYNRIDSDLEIATLEGLDADHLSPAGYDQETLTFGATYELARNLRLLAEYTRDIENETDRIVLGTVTAF